MGWFILRELRYHQKPKKLRNDIISVNIGIFSGHHEVDYFEWFPTN